MTQPLFSNCLSSQQQRSEVFVPNKVKLEPINRSQLQIKSSNGKNAIKEEDGNDDDDDDQEPVNMSTKEELNDEDEGEEDEHDDDDVGEDEEEHHRQSTRNLLTNVSSPVHA